MPFLLFYHDDHLTTIEQKLASIKRSLSKAFRIFYPLDDHVKVEEVHVEYDYCGVYYVEARARCRLSQVLEEPELDLLKPIVLFELYDIRDLVAAVQVTSFDCGGLAICLCILHKVGDSMSCITFLNSWSTIARKDMDQCKPFVPIFRSAKLFPPTKPPDNLEPLSPIMKKDFITKRFVFRPSSISTNRDKYTDSEKKLRPSRVEALQSFLLRRHMEAMHRKNYILVVNMRQRMVPPLTARHFGNFINILKHKMKLDEPRECDIVSQVRGLITDVGLEYVKQIQNADEYMKSEMKIQKESCEKDMMSIPFTSLCMFPMYAVDMRWGKHAWVMPTGRPESDLEGESE